MITSSYVICVSKICLVIKVQANVDKRNLVYILGKAERLDTWYILTEDNELSAILDDWRYACYVTSGVVQIFILTASDQYEPKTRFWLLFQISNWMQTF
jgi:hypothetical protein